MQDDDDLEGNKVIVEMFCAVKLVDRRDTSNYACKCVESKTQKKAPKNPEQAYKTQVRGRPSYIPVDKRYSCSYCLIETVE